MRRRLIQIGVPLALLLAPGAGWMAGPARAATAQASLSSSLSNALNASGGADGAEVLDTTTGQVLYSSAAGTPRLPASVEKVYTTSTALQRFGSGGTLTTSILATGSAGSDGVWRGVLYLKGGGDPTFGSASFDHYAYGTGATMQRLVTNLVHAKRLKAFQGRIVGDETIFDSRRGTPATGYRLSSEVEGLLSGVAYDRGFANLQGSAFQARPALFAASSLATALRAAHIRLLPGTKVSSGRAPRGATTLATVHSPRMSTITRLTDTPSDNYLAEMLLKGLGARFGGAGTTAAGARVVKSQLAQKYGIHPQLNDGSGLSRADRTSPQDIVTVLSSLASYQPFTSSLAVAGETGTMAAGLSGTYAQGRCRGKTGTLHDVANLVGLCTARDGHALVFAFMMNGLGDPNYGHSLEDRMAVSVARFNG